MSWLLDQMIGSMQPGSFKTFLQNAKPFVAGYLNDQLTNLAPDLVGTVTDIGHRMSDLTKNFGVEEQLSIIHLRQSTSARSSSTRSLQGRWLVRRRAVRGPRISTT